VLLSFIFSAQQNQEVIIIYNSIEANLEVTHQHYDYKDKAKSSSSSSSSLSILSSQRIPTKANLTHIYSIIQNKNRDNIKFNYSDFMFILNDHHNDDNMMIRNNDENNNYYNDDSSSYNNSHDTYHHYHHYHNYRLNSTIYHDNISTYIKQLYNKIYMISSICQLYSSLSLSACISSHISEDYHNITSIVTKHR